MSISNKILFINSDEKLRNATDPLLVKILKPPSSTFGISLSGASSPGSPIWITEVKQGSIADRYKYSCSNDTP